MFRGMGAGEAHVLHAGHAVVEGVLLRGEKGLVHLRIGRGRYDALDEILGRILEDAGWIAVFVPPMTPPGTSGVALVMPASFMASALANIMWPSERLTQTGLSGRDRVDPLMGRKHDRASTSLRPNCHPRSTRPRPACAHNRRCAA